MANQVELSVKTDLEKVIGVLQKIRDESDSIPQALKTGTKEVENEVQKQVTAVESFLSKTMKFGDRLAKNLKDDFKFLFNIQKVAAGLQLSNQFKNSATEAVHLADTIRKLAPVFKMNNQEFTDFQAKMVKGLGEIGLSSEVAVEALKGLAETPVRGKEALIDYSKTAGQLASITSQRGQEGAIAKGISGVITARGGNPNDVKQEQGVAEDVRRVHNQTGATATKILEDMQSLFSNMPSDLRKRISTRGAAKVAAGEQVVPGAKTFIDEYLSKSKLKRLPFEAQGLKEDIFTNKGLDTEKFKKFFDSITKRIGFDPEAAAETLGITEDAAKAFIRLGQNMKEFQSAEEGIDKATGDLNSEFQDTKTMSEAFQGSLNRMKGFLAKPISQVTNKAADALTEASKTDTGAAMVTGGSAVVAALLTGGGGKGLIKDFLGGQAKEQAYEAVTGEKIQKVWVVNASDIGGGGVGGTAAAAGGGIIGAVSKVAAVGTAAVAGYELGEKVISPMITENTQGTVGDKGFQGDVLERAMYKLAEAIDRMPKFSSGSLGNILPTVATPKVKIEIDMKSPKLNATVRPSRGVSN